MSLFRSPRTLSLVHGILFFSVASWEAGDPSLMPTIGGCTGHVGDTGCNQFCGPLKTGPSGGPWAIVGAALNREGPVW